MWWVLCKDCLKEFPMRNVYHLIDGRFLCIPCFVRDEVLRMKFGIESNELMINSESLNSIATANACKEN